MTPESLFALADARGLTYQRTSAATKPQWPLEDVALAMAEMIPGNDAAAMIERDRCYAAFAWRWARDKSQFPKLWASLLITTADRSLREGWPRKVSGELYIERLVELALLEEQHPWLVKKLNAHATLMSVEEQVWDRRLSRRYEAVRYQLEVWCGTVHSHMSARMGSRSSEQSVACA